MPDLPVEAEGRATAFTGCVDGNLKSWVAAIDTAEEGDAVLRLHGPWLPRGVLDPRRRRDPPDDRGGTIPGSPPEDLAEQQAILDSIRIEPTPASDPPEEPSADLGIFEPVAGRIVYYARTPASGPSTRARPRPSRRWRASTSGNGRRRPVRTFTAARLVERRNRAPASALRSDRPRRSPYDRYLYILHADGTETQVTPEPVGGAAISPDGSRVAFAAGPRTGCTSSTPKAANRFGSLEEGA